MIKKIMVTISTLLIFVTVLTGCGKADPVQEDLINYLNNQLPTLAELAVKATSEFEAATADNNATDATFALKLKDVIIPVSDELLTKTKAVVPATEELLKVHSKYIALVTEQHEAYALYLKAAQKNDVATSNTANEKMEHSVKATDEFLADLEALKKEHKVVTEK